MASLKDTNIIGTLTVNGGGVEVVEYIGNNCIRYSSGLQICWGLIIIDGYNHNRNTIEFEKPFKDNNYGVSFTPIFTGGATDEYMTEYTSNNSSASSRTEQSFQIVYTVSGSWIAIGKWK